MAINYATKTLKTVPNPDVPKPKGGGGKHTDWELVEADYIHTNLTRPDKEGYYDYHQVAKKWGLTHGTVRNKASKMRWHVKLEQQRESLRDKVTHEMKERNLIDELEIRNRHIQIARAMLAKVAKRLSVLDANKLSVKEMTDLARLGHNMEKAMAGIPDEFHVSDDRDDGPSGRFTSNDAREVIRNIIKVINPEQPTSQPALPNSTNA